MPRTVAGLVAISLLVALAGVAVGEPVHSVSGPIATAQSWALAESAPAFGEETPPPVGPPAMGSSFPLASQLIEEGGLLAARGMGTRKDKPKKAKPGEAEKPGEEEKPGAARRLGHVPHALSGERARLMLQSLTVPGWGQSTLGDRRGAITFGLLEAGVWGSFTAFKIQQTMRQQTYERTARLFAGIDLSSRDEEYRRTVGFYLSSDEYNRLVVRRDAANLYFGDPAAYDAYVAAHELKGADAWAWDDVASLLRYRTERQSAQRAIKHAHDALAVAMINRLLSAIHASAGSAHRDAAQTSWKLECVPAGGDPTAFHLGLRADF
jgi:hypothetical protein